MDGGSGFRRPRSVHGVDVDRFGVAKGIEEVDRVVANAGLELAELPRPALFLAGKVFLRYQAQGGTRSSILPDFFIGAHAAVARLPLLTRDPRRYRMYFSGIELIAPNDADPA